MYSVLIPIYNYEVTQLVKALAAQADILALPYEIRCYDDGSGERTKSVHQALLSSPHIVYRELPSNLGRAAIRNLLAREAVYDNLLFLDGDSGILGSDFLSKYAEHFDNAIICGGRTYSTTPPSARHILHWKYGHQRETRSLAERRANPVRYFHSNNFMVQRKVILDQPFDESILGYGYEDLFLAGQLMEKGIQVHHIENPVEHLALEENAAFIEKTQNAVRNLKQLNAQGLSLHSKLESYGKRLEASGLAPLFRMFYKIRRSSIERNLFSANPNLRYLDYKKLWEYLI